MRAESPASSHALRVSAAPPISTRMAPTGTPPATSPRWRMTAPSRCAVTPTPFPASSTAAARDLQPGDFSRVHPLPRRPGVPTTRRAAGGARNDHPTAETGQPAGRPPRRSSPSGDGRGCSRTRSVSWPSTGPSDSGRAARPTRWESILTERRARSLLTSEQAERSATAPTASPRASRGVPWLLFRRRRAQSP